MIPKYRAYDSGSLCRMYQPEEVMVGNGDIWIIDEDSVAGDWIVNNDIELMQSTGLKDKNGQEIFEGDILTDEGFELDEFWSYVHVIFKDGMWYCMPTQSEGYSGALNEFNKYYSVVGNVYQTPELLEEDHDRD